jgi:tRNA(Ile)-lysidine synthetase-like protein
MSKKNIDCLKLINYIETLPEFKVFLQPRIKLLIAYSGGQDSTALLAIFYLLSKKWQFKLAVVYCNHGWVDNNKSILNALSVLKVYKLPVYLIDCLYGYQKSETEARKWRYTAFEEIRKKGQYDFVLTGHTLSDKVETLLFNLCRGAGLKGVSSLKSKQQFNLFTEAKVKKDSNMQFKYQTMSVMDYKKASLNGFFLQPNSNRLLRYPSNSVCYYLFYCYQQKKRDLNGWVPKFNQTIPEEQLKALTSLASKNSFSLITFFHPTSYFLIRRFFIHCSYVTQQPYLGSAYFYNQTFFYRYFFHFKLTNLLKKKSKQSTGFPKPMLQLNTVKNKGFVFRKKNSHKIKCINKQTNIEQSNKKSQTISQKQTALIIMRPLIKVHRFFITGFIKQLKLAISFDASNHDLTITRNYIRYKIIPLFKYINPRFEQNLYRFSEISRFYFEMSDKKKDSDGLGYFRD